MRRSEEGFTLVEALVALVIVFVTGFFFFQTIVDGTHVARKAGDQEAALVVARSRLAELGNERPLIAGEFTGTSADDISWRLVVWPHVSDLGTVSAVHPNAFWATVTASWRDRRTQKKRSLSLKTLKLKTAR